MAAIGPKRDVRATDRPSVQLQRFARQAVREHPGTEREAEDHQHPVEVQDRHDQAHPVGRPGQQQVDSGSLREHGRDQRHSEGQLLRSTVIGELAPRTRTRTWTRMRPQTPPHGPRHNQEVPELGERDSPDARVHQQIEQDTSSLVADRPSAGNEDHEKQTRLK